MSETNNVSPEEIAEKAPRNSGNQLLDTNGHDFETSANYVRLETKRADRFADASPEELAAGHQFASNEEAKAALEASKAVAAQHVAENLPSYVALALQDEALSQSPDYVAGVASNQAAAAERAAAEQAPQQQQ